MTRASWSLVSLVVIAAACTANQSVPPSESAQQPSVIPSSGSPFASSSTPTARPATPSPAALARYSDNGISFEYPASWQLTPEDVQLRFGTIFAFVGTAPSNASCASASRGDSCVTRWNLQPGSVSVRFVTESGPLMAGQLFEQDLQAGWTRTTVGGMPAITATTLDLNTGGDMEISWMLSMPGTPDVTYSVEAAALSPGTELALSQVKALVASIQFVPPPMPLPTGSARDAAVSHALETLTALDQSYACFPGTSGVATDAVIEYFPGYSKTRKPVPVTCTTDIEETPIDLWRLTLTITWDAASDRKAGSCVSYEWVDAEGNPGGSYAYGSEGCPPYWP